MRRCSTSGPTRGKGLLLNTLAAIVVGGASLSGGIGGVHCTLNGVLIIALLESGLNLIDVNEYTQMLIESFVVVAVVIGQGRAKQFVIK
ncbi:MAG TPA: hypothetical protein VEK55_13900 [Xanthobacteraceae bacterium]|nr:hypothetical protein [Xanthobacteraceae bacterium]